MYAQWTCPSCPGICKVSGARHDDASVSSSGKYGGGQAGGDGDGRNTHGLKDETTQHILFCPSHAAAWRQAGACIDRLITRGIPKGTRPLGFLLDRDAMVSRISNCATFLSKGRQPSFSALRALAGSALTRVDRTLGIPAFGALGHHVASALSDPPCPCGDRTRPKHDSCTPVLPHWLHTKLGQLLNLDTDLFSSVSSLSDTNTGAALTTKPKRLVV